MVSQRGAQRLDLKAALPNTVQRTCIPVTGSTNDLKHSPNDSTTPKDKSNVMFTALGRPFHSAFQLLPGG